MEFMGETSEKFQESKRKNIWSDLLLEQSLTESTGRINVERKPGTEVIRGAETYDTSLKKFRDSAEVFQKKILDSEIEDYQKKGEKNSGNFGTSGNCETSGAAEDPFEPIYEPDAVEASKFSVSGEKKISDFGNEKNFGKKRKKNWKNLEKSKNFGKKEIPEKYIKNPVLNAADPPEKVGLHIARALEEKKIQLIVNLTKILGNEKSIEIFFKTQKIEKNGGILTANQERRRTPGGVFISLLKEDPDVDQKSVAKIFQFDSANFRPKLKAKKKNRGKNSQKNYEDHLAAAKEKLLEEKKVRELKNEENLEGNEEKMENLEENEEKNLSEEGELPDSNSNSNSNEEISPNSNFNSDEDQEGMME